jgi:sugar diacid utilization regulator
VRALSDVLNAPVQLVDEQDRPLAGADLGVESPRDHVRADDRRAVLTADGELVVCPVVAADEYLGCLVLRPKEAIDDADLRLIERGALGIALALVQQRAVSDATMRSRGELLTALVEGGEPDVLERRASAVRIDLSRDHVLALVDGDSPPVRRMAAELVRRHDGLVVDRAGRMLLLLPSTADLAALASMATVGVSESVCGAGEMPTAYAEARRCLVAAHALGRRNVVVTPASLGVYRFLLAPGGPAEAEEFVRRTVGPLLDHDRLRGTDLAATLEAYLAGGRSHSATAEALHIHPNTLYQRLARIGAVLGDDWRTPDRALDLHLALRLHRLADAIG